METQHEAHPRKPRVVTFVQILIYLAAILNVFNGIYSFGSAEMIKKVLCIVMIVFGIVAVYVASRLNIPAASPLNAAFVLSGILIVLRIVEFAVWHSIGFLLGVILPIIVIWRLNSPEAKAWFR
ncbi:hypothetical protein P4H61_04450 [Paenibacillus peoriae]|uniref:hypothetical protein n=1 Tax=Paenibacillus peoriae TaxID=59893 RepID=UPI00026C67CC|nr:hypothetical protein [Paenibacillus peoriae]MEC0180746.1 hypothetical protein [Paenibacillus peoriae]